MEMHISVLKGEDHSDHETIIKSKLKELTGDKSHLMFQKEMTNDTNGELDLMQFTNHVCVSLRDLFHSWPFDIIHILTRIGVCVAEWIWGRKHNFLFNIKDDSLPHNFVESETRDYEDAGLLLNSPYFSVLRRERDIDLIISLDFADGDPFKMSASKLQGSGEVRIGHSLNAQEEEFVSRRLQTVQQCLENHGIHCSPAKVPKIALLASGGGERAMLGLLGSLVELDKSGLLDCILYLTGVSGSTWCMASLYQDSDWSTKMDLVKEKITKRLKGPAVGFDVILMKLMKYYKEKDNFNLTDVWAALVVSLYVKEIDEGTLSQQRGRNDKDPFPIYAVIDKQYKQLQDGDPWVEISPYEAGYSLTGAFVDVSRFGSQFHEGSKKKDQPEMDMLYLQALCASAVADNDNMAALVWEKIKDFFHHIIHTKENEECEDTTLPPIAACQILVTLVEMNLLVLKGKDFSDLQQDIRTKLNELDGGESQAVERSDAKLNVNQFTREVFERLSVHFSSWLLDVLKHVCEWLADWIWGRKYNFLHNMKDERVPSFLVESEKRDFIDAGLLLNSAYFSVLRKERDVDLIISLDFSEGEPFLTVNTAAELCKNLNISFPKVDVSSEESKTPKDFYVFEGRGEAPTVIHIPLFNTVNCGADKVQWWREKYSTFQFSYSAEMIDNLLEVAGKNITNNKEKLVEEIQKIIKS